MLVSVGQVQVVDLTKATVTVRLNPDAIGPDGVRELGAEVFIEEAGNPTPRISKATFFGEAVERIANHLRLILWASEPATRTACKLEVTVGLPFTGIPAPGQRAAAG